MKVVALTACLYERRYGCFYPALPWIFQYFTDVFVDKWIRILKLDYFHVKLPKETNESGPIDRTLLSTEIWLFLPRITLDFSIIH